MWFRIIVGLRAGAEGEGEMSDNDSPAASRDPHVDFDAPAILRKWPSLNNQRRTDVVGPYLLLERMPPGVHGQAGSNATAI